MNDPARLPPDAARCRLALAFRAAPLGPHDPALAKLESLLRAGAVEAKYCLICTKPFAEWRIAQLSGQRGTPPRFLDDQVYPSVEAAEWAVFRLRWEAAFGESLAGDPE